MQAHPVAFSRPGFDPAELREAIADVVRFRAKANLDVGRFGVAFQLVAAIQEPVENLASRLVREVIECALEAERAVVDWGEPGDGELLEDSFFNWEIQNLMEKYLQIPGTLLKTLQRNGFNSRFNFNIFGGKSTSQTF